jgi:membrane fusion protein, multidrug efflux system
MRARLRHSILLVGASLAAACSSGEAHPAGSSSASAGPLTVQVVPVVEKKLATKVSLPADLLAYEEVAVYARVNAAVSSVKVDRGSKVKKGDVLVELDAKELTTQRMEAEAKLAGDSATLSRLEGVAKANAAAVSGQELDLARSAVSADAAKVGSLRTLESYLVIKAPFDAVVTKRNVHPGALVGATSGAKGEPMLELEEQSTLRLVVAVPEAYASMVRMDDNVDFTVRSWPGRVFKGKIRRDADSIDDKTRTVAVEADVDNGDGALAPGMFATVSLPVSRPEPSLFVPDGAVVTNPEHVFVVRIRDGKAEQVEVTRGVAEGGLSEVFGDLHAGDVVAKKGSEDLKPGMPVTTSASSQPSAPSSVPTAALPAGPSASASAHP